MVHSRPARHSANHEGLMETLRAPQADPADLSCSQLRGPGPSENNKMVMENAKTKCRKIN